MTGRLLAALVAAIAFLALGYRWGDAAATDRAAEQALQVEQSRSLARAIADNRIAKSEHNAAYDQYRISSAYQKGLSDGSATQKSVVARIRSGDLRLSIPTRPVEPGSGATHFATAAVAGRCDGQARAELSGEAAEFLTGLASEADDVVRQLGACQANLDSQRRTCNGDPVGK